MWRLMAWFEGTKLFSRKMAGCVPNHSVCYLLLLGRSVGYTLFRIDSGMIDVMWRLMSWLERTKLCSRKMTGLCSRLFCVLLLGRSVGFILFGN